MRNYIFDFNGTLFQDTLLHRDAWRAFFERRGIPFSEDNFYKYMCGPPNSDILRRFVDPGLTDEQIFELSEEKENIYREIILSDPALQVLTPGADAMLDEMAARSIPRAIATGADKFNMDFYMRVLGIGRWFDYGHIFCAYPGLPGKPDPAIYRLAMAKLGYDPAGTVVVEDGLAGVRSAIGAGIRTIIAIDSTHGAEAFKDIPEVIAIIHDFNGFEQFL